MTVKAILWTYGKKKDGTCNIKVYVSHAGKKKYYATDIHILPEHWDESRERVKSMPLAKFYNPFIQEMKLKY